MKSKFFIFIAMAFLMGWFSGIASGQEISFSPNLKGPSTCVRQYMDSPSSTLTIYYVDAGGSGHFLLYDNATPTTATASQLPNGYTVSEFEILNDTVYFCGTYSQAGSSVGIVGFISVGDLFYNNGNYTIGHIESIGVMPTIKFFSFDRMDLYVDANNIVHFALVGPTDHGGYRRSVADIWYDPHNNHPWVGSFLYQKYDLNRPTDITCTDNFVVVSGTTPDKKTPLLMVFKKIPNFPHFPMLDTVYWIKDTLYDSIVLVERMLDDDVALAYYYSDSRNGNGTSIHYINDINTLSMSWSSTASFYYPPSQSHLPYIPYDLRFNNVSKRLLLAGLTDLPSSGTLIPNIIQVDFPNNTHDLWTTTFADIRSADNRIVSYFSAGGEVAPFCLISLNRDNSRASCFNSASLTPHQDMIAFYKGPYEENYIDFSVNAVSRQSNPQPVPVTNVCFDSKTEEK